MSEQKLSKDLQGELGQRLAAGQPAAWREAIQRSEALEARVKYWKGAHSVITEVMEAKLSKMEEALNNIGTYGGPTRQWKDGWNAAIGEVHKALTLAAEEEASLPPLPDPPPPSTIG